ncbi:hypothetical protein ABZV91_28370 [Nocardia sp. NPDC004568]|uniref:hypothetical protein n=1 Tax=Nocardia sp. NPDC004568 TaxID=3154551 RepID=UPI0033BCD9D9
MTEDGASVDSVTGELATRLGAVGGNAGEAMRRGVRDAAGGAQTIALLVQADAAAAQQIEPADTAAPSAGPPAPAEHSLPATDTPAPQDASPRRDEPGDAGASTAHRPGSGDRPAVGDSPEPTAPTAPTATDGAVGDRSAPGPAATPHAAAEAHSGPGTATPAPKPVETAPPPPDPGRQPSAPAAEAPPSAPAADAPPPADAALPPAQPIAAAAAHHTPWTPTATEQASGPASGSTPWNSGTGSSMPFAPGMPGGLGSLTPQERPPRGRAPWARGRDSQEETVFPRPRPDRPNSTNRTEWAPS